MKRYFNPGMVCSVLMLTGCGLLSQHGNPQQVQHYTCGTLPLTVTLDNARQQATVILDGTPRVLQQTVAASGTRYADDQYVFWSKGNTARVERNQRIIINDCQLLPAAAQ